MISEANQKTIEAAGLSFILGMRIPHVSYLVAQWRRETPARRFPMGTSSPSPGRPGRWASGGPRSSITSTATTGRAASCAGSTSRSPSRERRRRKAPVKRNRFIRLSGGTTSVNRELYVTNLKACPDGTPSRLSS
jgi:hypothetical protein